MKLFSIYSLLIFGLSYTRGSLITNINNVINAALTSTVKDSNLSIDAFYDDFVDTVTAAREHGITSDNIVTDDITVCTEHFNESACNALLTDNCYDVKKLLRSAVSKGDDISQTFPTLVYHLYKPKCPSANVGMSHGKHKEKLPSVKVWGYGVGFCLLICFISNIGGLFGPLLQTKFIEKLLLFCVALAVGTLAATGFLVLVPESMHLTEDDSPIPDYHYKMMTVMAGVYFFYISEVLLKIWFSRDEEKPNEKTVEVGNADTEALNKDTALENGQNNVSETEHGHSRFNKKGKKKVATVAWMILIGDALHNFVDGISIGAAFTESTTLGVSVSLAILCEELPHELGDIAILLHAGMSMKRALFTNFIAAVMCLAGLVVGVILGESTDAKTWIFAIAGGMFIYIALVDMFNEMKVQATMAVKSKSGSALSVFFIQNIGLIIGFLIIAALVFFYE